MTIKWLRFIAVAAVADVLNCEDLDFTYYHSYVTPCQCIQASSGIGALSWYEAY